AVRRRPRGPAAPRPAAQRRGDPRRRRPAPRLGRGPRRHPRRRGGRGAAPRPPRLVARPPRGRHPGGPRPHVRAPEHARHHRRVAQLVLEPPRPGRRGPRVGPRHPGAGRLRRAGGPLMALLPPIIIDDVRPSTPAGFPAKAVAGQPVPVSAVLVDRKSTRLNSSHVKISYAVFCLKKKKKTENTDT